MDRIHLQVGRELRKKFKQTCTENQTTMVHEIRQFMKEYIQKHKKQ